MKKNLFLFMLFLFLIGFSVESETLVGAISYSVEEARELSFQGIKQRIDMSIYKENLYDKDFLLNQKAMLKNKKLHNKIITSFSDNSYSVRDKNLNEPCFYYDKDGVLEYIGFIEEKEYPKRYFTYDKKGELVAIDLVLANNEQYIFDMNKKMIAHWIGKNCYDENGELVLNRNSLSH